MQEQNPSENSPSNDDAPNPQGGEGEIMKTPWQVLEELCGGSSTPVAVAPVSEGVLQPKKRKTSEVRDPPRGKPICPVCNKEFTSWKAAFGHMRAHPNRDYRGFYKPPAFPSSSSSKDQPPPSANNNKGGGAKKTNAASDGTDEVDSGGGKEVTPSPNQLFGFDLNEPVEGLGSSHAVEEGVQEEKDLGFDLNEMPPAEDHEG
ncbi:zinc finger protein ZAT2 [Cajanus cajan]|uniref:zinc finger protein ZAT2 n=1 Tax=Cajanus cajan TaxID=3821 RepID=UPI00098D7A4B|nr:zinc finger protein ZAT2 [Cajanus cajan]